MQYNNIVGTTIKRVPKKGPLNHNLEDLALLILKLDSPKCIF